MTSESESLKTLVDAQGEKVRIMKEKMKEDPSSFTKADLDAEVSFILSTKACVRPWAERGRVRLARTCTRLFTPLCGFQDDAIKRNVKVKFPIALQAR